AVQLSPANDFESMLGDFLEILDGLCEQKASFFVVVVTLMSGASMLLGLVKIVIDFSLSISRKSRIACEISHVPDTDSELPYVDEA
ncbi:MAG: hypothetical protein ABG776_03965, partial [Cyanobacteria bacterium J06555_13]